MGRERKICREDMIPVTADFMKYVRLVERAERLLSLPDGMNERLAGCIKLNSERANFEMPKYYGPLMGIVDELMTGIYLKVNEDLSSSRHGDDLSSSQLGLCSVLGEAA